MKSPTEMTTLKWDLKSNTDIGTLLAISIEFHFIFYDYFVILNV